MLNAQNAQAVPTNSVQGFAVTKPSMPAPRYKPEPHYNNAKRTSALQQRDAHERTMPAPFTRDRTRNP